MCNRWAVASYLFFRFGKVEKDSQIFSEFLNLGCHCAAAAAVAAATVKLQQDNK
jgi:hypothetical protein